MRRTMLPLIALAAAACQPAALPLSDEDIAAIRSLGTTYAQANLAMDADAVAALYVEDAIEMPPNLPARMGRDEIREAYASWFAAGVASTEFTLTSVHIDGVDGLAYDRGTWTWTGVPPGATESITETGKHLMIARRQDDGSWRWTAGIWNSDMPLPAPGQD